MFRKSLSKPKDTEYFLKDELQNNDKIISRVLQMPATVSHLRRPLVRVMRKSQQISLHMKDEAKQISSTNSNQDECIQSNFSNSALRFGSNIRVRLSNNLQNKIKKTYHSSQKYETNQARQSNQINLRRYQFFTNKKKLKAPVSLFSVSNKISVSSSVCQNIQASKVEDDFEYQQFIKNTDIMHESRSSRTQQKSNQGKLKQPYFGKTINEFCNLNKLNQANKYKVNAQSAFDKFSHQNQKQTNIKQIIRKEDYSQDISANKIRLGDDREYFAESYRGRRPYNQDRYICETKNLLNLRQKLHQATHAPKQSASGKSQCINEGQSRYFLFGVFDGHGGAKCSEYLKQHFHNYLRLSKYLFLDPAKAIKQTFMQAEQSFLAQCQKNSVLQTSGSCAVVCLIQQNRIYVGNTGDSRLLLLGPIACKQVTKDHKPDDREEKMRIIKNGGKLYKDGGTVGCHGKENIRVFSQTRINPGNLNVSRTIGDIEIKFRKYGGNPGIVIAEPDIIVEQVTQHYEHVLLASDGLFQGFTNQQIHNFYKQSLQRLGYLQIKSFVKQIISKSSERSNDNITVICATLSLITK